MYLELPAVDGTPASRIEALKAAKPLLASSTIISNTAASATELIRVATYIETGHDYADTHPAGKRRPIIKNTTVHVHAAGEPSEEDVEHFLHHVENGDFADFLEDAMKQAQRDTPPDTDGN